MGKKLYEVSLKTIGPLHVGTGEILNKSQYLHDRRTQKIYIPKETDFFKWIIENKLIESYEKFITKKGSPRLHEWIDEIGAKQSFLKIADYSLDASSIFGKGVNQLNDIAKMVKDPNNDPYIPGSSLKGMIRNAIINAQYSKLRKEKSSEREFVRRFKNLKITHGRQSRDALRNLELNGEKLVNSQLKDSIKAEAYLRQGLDKKNIPADYITENILISDSQPVSKENLVLAQKIDKKITGQENRLIIFREAIGPDVEVKFKMIVKENPYFNIEDLRNYIYEYYRTIDQVFLKHFNVEKRDGMFCYLGGGSGYLSKTALYSLFEKDEAVEIASKIIGEKYRKKTRGQKKEKVAPKTLKLTRYKKRTLEMGLCQIHFKEVDEF